MKLVFKRPYVSNSCRPRIINRHVAKASADIDSIMDRTFHAQRIYSNYTQAQVDKIFKEAALAANAARIPLAKMAVEETGMGLVEDKVIKNHFASEYIYNKYKDLPTCGVVECDHDSGITKLAEPVGVIASIIPTTNPTSTAIFKSLLCLKTRNGIIMSPHPRAKHSTIAAAKIVYEAAVNAGAPEGIINWLEAPSLNTTQRLMQHPKTSLILSTGGPALVKASYSSGVPALGVGAGNTPAIIDDTAHIKLAVSSIMISKTFDNGVICASEQSVIVMDSIYEEVKTEFLKRGAYFLNEEEKQKVRDKIFINGKLNADIVGKSVNYLAQLFDIQVPEGTKLIIGEVKDIGKHEPLSEEKLSPVLAMYSSPTIEDAVNKAEQLVSFGGPGHTAVLYTNFTNTKSVSLFHKKINTVRLLVNTPASQGAIGDLYNFHLDPSLTLGCGTWGSTSVSTNVTPKHLLNYKTVIERRENMLWFRVPPKIYFKGGCLETALLELKGRKRVFIVTDKPLYDMGYTEKITKVLDGINVNSQIFYHVEPDPTLACIQQGLQEINEYKPDVIIAIGGGSPMDAAKIMWLLYEEPTIEFEGIATRFMDIRKRVYSIPELGRKALMICVPTTSGTGSEVTPFSVVTDEKTGKKYPLADYALTPNMAIIDPFLVMGMPKKLTAYSGIDAMTHAIESYVSVCATDFTKGLSREALSILAKYLPRAYNNGENDYDAREKVHYASTLAGMAFANAFLGICHSMAHKLGAEFHIPHGLANALLISHVIRYNATEQPMKQAIFPQYRYPNAIHDYVVLAKLLGVNADNDKDYINGLIMKIEDIKEQCNIPKCIGDVLGQECYDKYLQKLPQLAEEAFDDQCTAANCRYPLITDLQKLLLDAWSPIELCDQTL
jgi:acetaldehyde dehydrogenase/alcohol dehydrogenase